jgi:hypothetical protein
MVNGLHSHPRSRKNERFLRFEGFLSKPVKDDDAMICILTPGGFGARLLLPQLWRPPQRAKIDASIS